MVYYTRVLNIYEYLLRVNFEHVFNLFYLSSSAIINWNLILIRYLFVYLDKEIQINKLNSRPRPERNI